jgi:hypothetical protein
VPTAAAVAVVVGYAAHAEEFAALPASGGSGSQ